MGRGAASDEKSFETPAPVRSQPLRSRGPETGDVGETWQVIDRETGEILAERATEDLAMEFVDTQVQDVDVTGPDPV